MDRNHAFGRGEQRRSHAWRVWVLALGATALVWSALGVAFTARPAPDSWLPQSSDASSPTVTVRFVAQATAAQGATGSFRVLTQDAVPVGGRATAHLTAGTAAQPSLCRLGAVAPPASEPPLVWWQVAASVREIQADSVWLSLEWSREGLAPFGSAASASLGNVRLREGQSHVFDTVVAPPGGSTGCTNVLASVEVTVNRPASDANALLAYRLTLVNEGAGGRVASPALELVGRPAEAVPFRFRPVRWPVTADDTAGGPPPVEMDILGEMTATPRRDGQADVTASVARRLMFGTFHQGSGKLAFVARFGEEVRLELPPPAGSSLLRWDDPRALRGLFRPGVESEPGGIRARHDVFLGEVQTMLLVRVDRIR